MSSICGIYYRDGRPVDAAEIGGMVAALSHWGPDATGRWHHRAAGLGHAALWTTPEAVTERCPFEDPAARITVTADVRLDNRAELLTHLADSSETAAGIGDCELIARSYLKWGARCVEHLIGDFAFALWDENNQHLFCARDALGLRPFFYFADERRFLFGTEIKAILTRPDIPRDPDPLGYALFLLGGKLERDQTHFRAIRTLEPACAMLVRGSSIRRWRYWRLDPERELRFSRDEDYVDAFDEVFQRAVDARLRSTGGVGSMLSGGLDSTMVTQFARQSRRPPPGGLTAYTWALRKDDPWHMRDERSYVDAYLQAQPIPHRYLVPDPRRTFDDTPGIRHLQDGPNWSLGIYAAQTTFAAAQADNVRVLLMGDGGDEAASYEPPNYYFALTVTGQWRLLAAEAQSLASRIGAPLWKVWQNTIIRPWFSAATWRDPFSVQDRLKTFRAVVAARHHGSLFLAEELVQRAGLVQYLDDYRERPDVTWRNFARRRQIDGLTGSTVMSDLATRKFNSSVLSHIECRYPFLDRRVVEFCIAMPLDQHRRDGSARRLLRRSAARRLPPGIATRTDKSPTLPDYDRGVRLAEARLQAMFQRWTASPAIASYLRIGRLQSYLPQVIAHSHASTMMETRNFGGFCRAIFLGIFLENDPGVHGPPPA